MIMTGTVGPTNFINLVPGATGIRLLDARFHVNLTELLTKNDYVSCLRMLIVA